MFRRETGALIDERGFIWDIIIGDSASLLYSDEKIWQMSKFVRKIILAHSHPPYFTSMSGEDSSTLLAWSYALPNRIEMQIISQVGSKIMVERNMFIVEPLQSWIDRGKVGERKIKLETRPDFRMFRRAWVDRLIELSYS